MKKHMKQKKIKGELTKADLAKVKGGVRFFFFKRWAIPVPPSPPPQSPPPE